MALGLAQFGACMSGASFGGDYVKGASSSFQAASLVVQTKAIATAAATADKVIARNATANGTIMKATERALIAEGVPKGEAEQFSVIAAIKQGPIIAQENTEKTLAPKRKLRVNNFYQITPVPTAPTIDSSTTDLTKDL